MGKGSFYYQIASDKNYEELLIQVYIGSEMIAIINQEKGIDHPTLEIWPKADGKNWELDLKAFIGACEKAYTRLKDFQVQRNKDD